MSITPYYSLAVLAAVMAAPVTASADDRTPSREEMASIQTATRDLAREIEHLQDTVAEQDGEKERALYRQADAALAAVETFQKSLKPETSREHLYKAFDEQDRKLHELLIAVQALGPEQRLLKRVTARVRAADDELHYALSAGDASADRAKQVIKRQTRSSVDAAQRLGKTAGDSLGAVAGRGVLVGDLHKLAEEAEQFQKGLAAGKDREQLRKDFAAVNRAWERAIQGMRKLKVGDHMQLLRAAGQFDHIHERLYRLLGIEGERPQLIIRT